MTPAEQMRAAIIECTLMGTPYTVLGSKEAFNQMADFKIEQLVAKFKIRGHGGD